MTGEALKPTWLIKQGAIPAQAFERIAQRIAVWRGQEPDDDESWESFYPAAFDMLIDEVDSIISAASPPAPAEVEPVAWCAFADNGNIRLWSPDHARQVRASGYFLDMRPLYTAEALSAARAEARREALGEAAAWHDDQAALHDAQGEACGMGSDGWKRHTVAAADHRRSSVAIRALSGAAPAEEG